MVTALQAPEKGFSKDLVEAIADAHGEPDWLRRRRRTAYDVFAALPLPTTEDPAWHRTDISDLVLDDLAANRAPAGDKLPADLRRFLGPREGGLLLQRDAGV